MKILQEFLKIPSLSDKELHGTEFRCSYIATAATQWFLGLSKDIIDEPEKNCTGELAQFGTSTYLEISKVSQAFNSMTRDCPTECCCWYSQMTYSKEKEDFIYRVEVNCSHKNLTAIPIQKFPNYVSVLDISHNNIKSLRTIKENPHKFENLLVLLANNNNLQSIKDLEASKFGKQFAAVSLTSNSISINEDLMKFVTTRRKSNRYGSEIWLSNNKIEPCTCHMAQEIRPWLWNNSHSIKDHRGIYCLNNTKHVKMLFLYEESICKKEQNGISQFPWDGFIIFLSLLIALCLSIFFYDFWVYKKTSQLPWIVLKLSK
ncbi:protein halfway-like isoform X3 [Artemia franciscana]|uniref:protein halfway-like isoform X3 n=1 Tax=Artemia franciscana TaxID=6661 RepID=UPI0032DA4CB8